MHNPRLPCWFPTKSDALLQLCILMLCIKKKLTVFKSFCRILAGVGTCWIVILDNTGLRASTPADVPKIHTRTCAYIVDSQWKGGPPWSSAARLGRSWSFERFLTRNVPMYRAVSHAGYTLAENRLKRATRARTKIFHRHIFWITVGFPPVIDLALTVC